MTCREKLEKEHPEDINEDYMGGCLKCPHNYGYLPEISIFECERIDCRDCWNREIPETEKLNTEIPWGQINKMINDSIEKRDRSFSLSFIPGMGVSISVYPWTDDENECEELDKLKEENHVLNIKLEAIVRTVETLCGGKILNED